MLLKNKGKKKHRGVYTIDLSTTGQGLPPYKVNQVVFSPLTLVSHWATASVVSASVTPLGSYTAPATFQWYSGSAVVASASLGAASANSSSFGYAGFATARTGSFRVVVTTPGGSNTFAWQAIVD